MSYCFFFQAEDGIRDGHVTGVQTCALPISALRIMDIRLEVFFAEASLTRFAPGLEALRFFEKRCRNSFFFIRSEERRVGKDGGYMNSLECDFSYYGDEILCVGINIVGITGA